MSILTQPKSMLNPDLFESPDEFRTKYTHGKLKKEVQRFIISELEKLIPIAKVHRIIGVGSNFTYQWNPGSDVDVTVMGVRRIPMEAYAETMREYSRREVIIPGTNAPLEFFFAEFFDVPSPGDDPEKVDEMLPNTWVSYDIWVNDWIKKPMTPDEIGDPLERYERELATARLYERMIDSEVQRMIRALITGHQSVVDDAHANLLAFFHRLRDKRRLAFRYGIGMPSETEYNVVWKYLEGTPHYPLLRALRDKERGAGEDSSMEKDAELSREEFKDMVRKLTKEEPPVRAINKSSEYIRIRL